MSHWASNYPQREHVVAGRLMGYGISIADASPPIPIAIHCFEVWEMPSASNTWIGVNRPTKWQENDEHVSPHRQHALAAMA